MELGFKRKKERKRNKGWKVVERGRALGDCGESHPTNTLAGHLDD